MNETKQSASISITIQNSILDNYKFVCKYIAVFIIGKGIKIPEDMGVHAPAVVSTNNADGKPFVVTLSEMLRLSTPPAD